MATPSAIPTNATRETIAKLHRVTRGNRSLWYMMTVLQQPERARACGSGMKANSDRRPVDPPPVVELRIIEGPTIEEGKDVTFDYNANFFLYASLEHARQLAHGRVSTPAANNPPILTGVPASGMAYLDRPAEAGYFIFPDLSVRHEGLYRLTFSLFETTKEEQDFDIQPADGDLPPGVDFRMEIKTNPFMVFSAKKFPGLMESTQLSKTVADQGCRVRIRRDVRMRKRDSKPAGNNNNNNNNNNNAGNNGFERREEDYGRRRTVTPAAEVPHGIRNRSQSNSSEHQAPYADASRRPSMVDSYPPPPPPSYDPAPSAQRHLSFGDPSASKYQAPRQYAHQPGLQITPVSANGSYPPTAQSPYTKNDATYGYVSRHIPPSCPSPAPSVNRDLYDRRQSTSTYVPPSPSVYSTEGHYRRDSQPSYPSTPAAAAPLPRLMNTESSRGSLKISALVEPMPIIEPQVDPLPELPPVNVGGKRKHENVFSQSTRPLYNGQRQMDPHYSRTHRGYSPEHGSYSRADGRIDVIEFNKFS